MATVIGVRFKKAGKVYYFDPNGLWPKPGENVVIVVDEHPLRGPAKLLHNPVVDLAIKTRNVETLRRLESQARAKTS